jgi:hypothetical protein
MTATTLLPQVSLEKLLRRDYRFLLVFLAAATPRSRHLDEVEDFATRLLISKSEFRALRNSLLKHEYWRLTATGFIQSPKDHVDLGEMNLHEFTNISLGLLTHISEDGPCNYENLFVVTTEELKREFYSSVNRCLKTLVQKSAEAKGDRVVAWNHIGLDFGNFESGLMSKMAPASGADA